MSRTTDKEGCVPQSSKISYSLESKTTILPSTQTHTYLYTYFDFPLYKQATAESRKSKCLGYKINYNFFTTLSLHFQEDQFSFLHFFYYLSTFFLYQTNRFIFPLIQSKIAFISISGHARNLEVMPLNTNELESSTVGINIGIGKDIYRKGGSGLKGKG